MFNHKNTPSYFLKKTTAVSSSSNSDLVTSQRHEDVTQDVRDKCLSPAVRVRNVTKHLPSPGVTTHPKIRISSSSSLSPRDSCDRNTEKITSNISAKVGGGGIPRDTETGEKVTSETVTQIPIQIKHKKRSASPLTSSEAKEEMKIEPKNVEMDDFDSGQEYKSVTVSTHWAWDDIFHTVNTTDEEGKQNLVIRIGSLSDKQIYNTDLDSVDPHIPQTPGVKHKYSAHIDVLGNETEIQVTTRIMESANSPLLENVMQEVIRGKNYLDLQD